METKNVPITATKAELMDFICANYTEVNNVPVSLAKLDSCKKSVLELFIKREGQEDNLIAWLENKKNS